jgi:hypothetical protein
MGVFRKLAYRFRWWKWFLHSPPKGTYTEFKSWMAANDRWLSKEPKP